jgi:hypothetical protein
MEATGLDCYNIVPEGLQEMYRSVEVVGSFVDIAFQIVSIFFIQIRDGTYG